MNKITEKIYLGSSQDAQHRKRELKEAGVTAILNVARDLTNATTTHKEFEMYHVGLMDGGGNATLMAFAAMMVLHSLLESGHTVLVHCHEGKSRSAGLVSAYLFGHQDHPEYSTFEEAEDFLRTCRPRVDVNKDVKQLFLDAMVL
jgi:protein-tyrosine phosphatase